VNVIGVCEISAFHHDGYVLEPCAYGLLHGVSWVKFSDFQHIWTVQSEPGCMGLTVCPNTLVNFNYLMPHNSPEAHESNDRPC